MNAINRLVVWGAIWQLLIAPATSVAETTVFQKIIEVSEGCLLVRRADAGSTTWSRKWGEGTARRVIENWSLPECKPVIIRNLPFLLPYLNNRDMEDNQIVPDELDAGFLYTVLLSDLGGVATVSPVGNDAEKLQWEQKVYGIAALWALSSLLKDDSPEQISLIKNKTVFRRIVGRSEVTADMEPKIAFLFKSFTGKESKYKAFREWLQL